jgi:hypothetical protein
MGLLMIDITNPKRSNQLRKDLSLGAKEGTFGTPRKWGLDPGRIYMTHVTDWASNRSHEETYTHVGYAATARWKGKHYYARTRF